MAFRFRRSFKIAPGIKLNVGSKGVGVSAGIRGARIGINRRGTYTSVGIPGTGISSLSYNKSKPSQGDMPQANPSKALGVLAVLFAIFVLIVAVLIVWIFA